MQLVQMMTLILLKIFAVLPPVSCSVYLRLGVYLKPLRFCHDVLLNSVQFLRICSHIKTWLILVVKWIFNDWTGVKWILNCRAGGVCVCICVSGLPLVVTLIVSHFLDWVISCLTYKMPDNNETQYVFTFKKLKSEKLDLLLFKMTQPDWLNQTVALFFLITLSWQHLSPCLYFVLGKILVPLFCTLLICSQNLLGSFYSIARTTTFLGSSEGLKARSDFSRVDKVYP